MARRSTLDRHAKARAAELRKAERWVKKHGVGSLPGRRTEGGETAVQERSEWLGGRDRADSGTGGSHSKHVSYSQFPTLEAWEDWMLDTAQPYVPLVGGVSPSGLDSIEKRARMAHVLTFLPPEHIELLYARHVRQRTLDSIAEEHSVTRQAIIKRLRVAEQDFRRAFGNHWNDPIDALEV